MHGNPIENWAEMRRDIEQRERLQASDPLDYMNKFCVWPDPPPADFRWEKKVAAACDMISERDATIAQLTEQLAQKDAEIERLMRAIATSMENYDLCYKRRDAVTAELERLREGVAKLAKAWRDGAVGDDYADELAALTAGQEA
jgi:hypothetical protein